MKKFIVLMIVLSLLPIASAIEMNTSSTNIESQYPDLYVSVLKYEPYPISPGEYFDLWLEIENKGIQDAENVKFTLNPKYPFSLNPDENAEREIGRILSHSSLLTHYKVRVDENAVEGESLIDYFYSVNSKKPVEGQIPVIIQSPKAILSVENVTTTPPVVAPGETAEVEITLKNNADSYLKFITASMQLLYSSLSGSSASTSTSSFVELPFTPLGGGNEKSVHQLAPGEDTTFNFMLVADPEAEIKPYKIPVNIDYFDELGKNYSKTEILGVIIGSEPDLYALVENSELFSRGDSGEIQIRFVNKGTSPVKFLNVNLEETEDYNIVSSEEIYLGEIDSDDYDTAEFRLYLKSNEKEIKIPVSYEFMDGNNKEYSVEDTLNLEIHNKRELGQGGSGAGWIIFAVIIIVIAYLVYRRWHKKGKKKK